MSFLVVCWHFPCIIFLFGFLQMSKKKSRCRVCEYWIQVAKECLNIRNFNSLMAILAGLNILPVARLKKTVSFWHSIKSIMKLVDVKIIFCRFLIDVTNLSSCLINIQCSFQWKCFNLERRINNVCYSCLTSCWRKTFLTNECEVCNWFT